MSDQESDSCQNAFKPGQLYVAYSTPVQLFYPDYNQFPQPISISTSDKEKTFNVESIEALFITSGFQFCETSINGIRKNQTCFTRRIKADNELQLITLNWTNIDKLTIDANYGGTSVFAISQIIIALP